MNRRLHPALPLAATVLALTLSGCSSSSKAAPADEKVTATPTAQVTAAPAADAKVIRVNLSATAVSPEGAQISVRVGQPVVFEITSTVAGEIHVHSTPEKQIEVPVGASQVTLTFDQPGLIDVEDHLLDKLIAQLKVQ